MKNIFVGIGLCLVFAMSFTVFGETDQKLQITIYQGDLIKTYPLALPGTFCLSAKRSRIEVGDPMVASQAQSTVINLGKPSTTVHPQVLNDCMFIAHLQIPRTQDSTDGRQVAMIISGKGSVIKDNYGVSSVFVNELFGCYHAVTYERVP